MRTIKKFNIEKTKQLDKINKVLEVFYHKPVCKKIIKLNCVKKILIIDFALMGDMVMNIPFLRTIKRNCPNAKITMVGMSWSELILGDQDLVDEFIIFDGKNKLSSPKEVAKNLLEIRNVLKRINQKKYEIGFEPKGDLRHILFLHYTNCEKTVSYNYTGGEYLVTDSFIPKANTKHLIDEKLDLLEMAGFTIFEEDMIPYLNLSQDSKRTVEEFVREYNLLNKRIIGIHPGASNRIKQYRCYNELVKNIAGVLRMEDVIAVFEGPEEEKIVDGVVAQLQDRHIRYVRVKRRTKEYVALISICDYMICNDSAAGHIAAAYGIPVFVIFGPIKPENALPKGYCSVKFASHDLECKPCTLPTCPLGTEECIKKINMKDVLGCIVEDLKMNSE